MNFDLKLTLLPQKVWCLVDIVQLNQFFDLSAGDGGGGGGPIYGCVAIQIRNFAP